MKTLDSLVEKALSRRSFFTGAGAIAAGATLAGCSGQTYGPAPTPPPTPVQTTYTDADILNYALNLEYLEAQFYLYAATGNGLAAADTTPGQYSAYTMGTVTVPTGITAIPGLTSAQQEILNEIAYEEQQHVRFLRTALGTAAVAMPSIDLTFFGPLAVAAGITTVPTGTGSFTPFDDFNDFLLGAFIFEDVGVTAYAGAAPLISAAGVTSGYLDAAAGILAVEAYHASYVRTAITASDITMGTSLIPIANKIEALRAALTVGNNAAPSTMGSVETQLVLPTSPSTPSAIVAASATNAVAFSRSVNQVHHIVYGDPTVGVAKGGFFPNGTNSFFATTTA